MFLAFKRDYLDIDTAACCLPVNLTKPTWIHVEIILPIPCSYSKSCTWCLAPCECQPASDGKHYVNVTVTEAKPTHFIVRSDKHLGEPKRTVWSYIYIPLPDIKYQKVYDFLHTQQGKPYPSCGRLHYWWYWCRRVVSRSSQYELLHATTWTCSELATACLIYIGYDVFPDAPCFTTPCILYDIASSLEGAVVQTRPCLPNSLKPMTASKDYVFDAPPLTCMQRLQVCMYRWCCFRFWFPYCRRRRLLRT